MSNCLQHKLLQLQQQLQSEGNIHISMSILQKEIEIADNHAWLMIRYLNRIQKWKYPPDNTLKSKYNF